MADASTSQVIPAASGSSAKATSSGANPNTDYKSRYLRCKDKYDRVSSDQTEIKTSITKATQKQHKLRDEINFLLDVIGMKQAAKRMVPYEEPASYSPAPRDASLLYSSAAEPPQGQYRYPSADTSRHPAYQHNGTPPSRSQHYEYEIRGASPPPQGGYKRPRSPSDDPEELRKRESGAGLREEAEARAPERNADEALPASVLEPASKRPRNS